MSQEPDITYFEPWRRRPVEEAWEFVQRGMGKGVTCPCCAQYCKYYAYKLSANFARALIWLVRVWEQTHDWIHIPTAAPRDILQNRKLNKLQYWGLVELGRNDDTSKRTSGMWRPTELGVEFAHGRTTVPLYKTIYNNQVFRTSEETVTIREALSIHFDYAELMSAPLDLEFETGDSQPD